MKCKLGLVKSTDRTYLVKWNELEKYIDQHDLACREARAVQDAYHRDWLRPDDSGVYRFEPPAFYLEKRVMMFINGRHRTILLSKYLRAFPMALVDIDEESQSVLQLIAEREMQEDELFELPDLPIRDAF